MRSILNEEDKSKGSVRCLSRILQASTSNNIKIPKWLVMNISEIRDMVMNEQKEFTRILTSKNEKISAKEGFQNVIDIIDGEKEGI